MKRTISILMSLLMVASSASVAANAAAKNYVKSIKVAKKASVAIPADKKTASKSFKVTVKVSGKASKAFTAKTSNKKVATVKVKGSKINVTAKKAGKAVITVTTKAKNQKGKKLSAKLNLSVTKKKPTTPTTPETPDTPDVPDVPDEPSEDKREITATTTTEYVTRQASSGKDENGNEQVVDIEVLQAKTVFNYAPANVEELKQVDRTGDNGRFAVVACYFAALKAFDPKNPDVAYAMMEELCESSTTKVLNIDSFNNFSKSAMKDNLSKSYKYKYLGNAYFDGALQSNGYTPTEPLTVTVEDYVYAPQASSQYQTDIWKITSRIDGADSERIIQVYKCTIDEKWYIFSDSWTGFTADIKEPPLKYMAQYQQG